MKHYIKGSLFLITNFLFWRGFYDTVLNTFPNKCEMTYMYEYPEYIEVNITNTLENNYKLFVYGEGRYASQLKKCKYKGIPVLFIPGNQGSPKQVRSMASVAYRMAQTYSTAFHFNYFAVDFNEETGALFGSLLSKQTKFVELSIKKILSLYKDEAYKPRSVILVGHSMGGLVARAVLGLPDLESSLVSLIITEATPHSRPVVIPDNSLQSFMATVDTFWKNERYLKLKNVVLVTIGGGKNDIQVSSTLTTSEFADIDETLLSVPSCWLTTDHLAIVWCKQLMLALNRALFNSIDTSTLQLSCDRNHVIQSFKNQLSEKVSAEIPRNSIEQKLEPFLSKKKDLIELTTLQSFKTFKNTLKSKLFLIPLTLIDGNHLLSIVLKDVSSRSFVVSGKVNNGNNSMIIDYKTINQHYLRTIPNRQQEVNIDLTSFQNTDKTYVFAYVEPESKQATFALDISKKNSHTVDVIAPDFVSALSPVVVMRKTPINSLSINITIQNFTEYWQSFILHLTPFGTCPIDNELPLVSFRTSWMGRWEYVMRKTNETNEFLLGLDVPSPTPGYGHVEIHIIKNPLCTYTIRLQQSVRGIFDRISVLSVPQMPSYLVSHLLLILGSQFQALNDDSFSPLPSIIVHLTPFSVVPLMKLSGFLLNKFSSIDSDKSYMEKHRTNMEVLPILLFVSAIPLTYILVILLKSLFVISTYVHHLFYSYIWYRNKNIVKETNYKVGSSFFNSSTVFSVLLLSLGISICGALGLALALCYYFVKILKIKCDSCRIQDKSKDNPEKSESSIEDKENDEASFTENSEGLTGDSTQSPEVLKSTEVLRSYEIHLTLLALLTVIFILNLPSLATLIKNSRWSEGLSTDPLSLPFKLIVPSLAMLWRVDIIKSVSVRYFKVLNYGIKMCSILVILFGSVHLYRISEIVSLFFVLVAFNLKISTT